MAGRASWPRSGWPNSASRNGTRVRLRAAGGVEFGAAHYPLMVALHAFWLLGLWMLGHARAVDPFWLRGLRRAAGGPGVGDREPRPALDHPGDRAAGRGAGCARALSLARHPNYLIVVAGDRGGAAGARLAAVCAGLFARQCGAAGLPHPGRKPGAGLGRARAAPEALTPTTLANG